jgi:hypothetical protein
MLKIKNIGKIVGMYSNGREIIEAGDYKVKDGMPDYFVFKIAKQNDGKDYNKEHDIVLRKQPEANGKYYMFRMGLELVTGVVVDFDEIKTPIDICHWIRNVLVKTQTYYQTDNVPF